MGYETPYTCFIQALADDFGLDAGTLHEPGTTVIADAQKEADGWVSLWPIAERVVVREAPAICEPLQAWLAGRPGDYRLSLADAAAIWARGESQTEDELIYVRDGATFQPTAPDCPYPVRRLESGDRAAFTAFEARCSARDRLWADVSIDQEVAFGAWDGERLVALASTYRLYGGVDIGVLTDPAYRGRRAGRAVVWAATMHYPADGAQVIYRHAETNLGSRGIAVSLGFTHVLTLPSLRISD
jgi:GNAT superfamily N-acetyltransferase